jgi:hypothetical protein
MRGFRGRGGWQLQEGPDGPGQERSATMKHEFNTKAWDRFWLAVWFLAIIEDARQEELRKKREAERERQEQQQEEWKTFIRRPPAPVPAP